MSTRLVLLVSLLAIAACGTDSPANNNSDGGTDATSGDGGAPDASADAGPDGCQPCVVGISTIGNCCLQ